MLRGNLLLLCITLLLFLFSFSFHFEKKKRISQYLLVMQRAGTDVSLYNAAIQGMCLRGKIESAKKLYMRMRKSGLKPDGKTRALMLQNLQKDAIRPSNKRISHPRRY